MPSNYIELFPSNSPRRQPLHNGSDDIYYFPPCRVHETSSDPSTAHNNGRKSSRRHQKRCPSPVDSEPKHSPHHSPLPKTGLGANNVVNTIQVAVEQAKGASKLSPKRRLEQAGADYPSKRQHVYHDDMEWLEREIDGIKEHMTDMDNKLLNVILREVQQFNEI